MGDAELQPFVTPEPQVSMLLRRAGDRALLLASDGVWGVLPDAEACAFAAEQSCAQAAAEALISVANARGGRDNASAIVVRWTGAAM
jgi:serine/threonine protein phosphatase PrpC